MVRTAGIPTHRFAAALLVFGILVAPNGAAAGELNGTVTDGPTGTPISDATVRVLGGSETDTTGPEGEFSLRLPPGEYDLLIRAEVGGETLESRLVRQRVPQYKPARARLFTDAFVPRSGPDARFPPGLPVDRRPDGPGSANPPVTLPLERPKKHRLTLPEMPQTTIRVARREQPDEGCSNNPIVAIEKMDLDTYVRGVLPPEIGVFRNLKNVEEVYRAFALAAKSYGLWFTLHYDQDNRRQVSDPLPPNGFTWFHIDDTACNQRYSDNRLQITNQAAADVAELMLARKSDPQTLHKYEYAASCGGHGTRPAYQQSLINDDPDSTACVGDWCGHQNCAGHEDNPNRPGDDRCLVRGMCQWGAAEWAKAGRDHRWILDHYQPNLLIRPLAEEPAVTVTGYVYTNPDDIEGSGVPDARVQLDAGETTRTNENGVFTFEDVPLTRETVGLSASKTGYQSNSRSKELIAGERNWASLRLRPSGNGDVGPDADGGARSDASDAGDAGRIRHSFGPLVSPASRDISSGGCATSGRFGLNPAVALLFVLALSGFGRWRSGVSPYSV